MKLNGIIIGAAIGGGIGGYLSWLRGNNLYAGFGGGVGALVGGLIEWLCQIWRWRHKKRNNIKRSNESLHRIVDESVSR
jgi:uncharacterized protein YcfJ